METMTETTTCAMALSFVGHECPKSDPTLGLLVGCGCEYLWCLDHGQIAKRCDGRVHAARLVPIHRSED